MLSDVVHALSLSTWRLPTLLYMQWMNTCGTLKINHKARVKFLVGSYVDTVDCNVAPLSVCHLLLGQPWQFDIYATHGGCFNCYLFVHKGIHHVFKPMLEGGIKSEVFAPVKKKYHTASCNPKLRMALLQGEENQVTISNTSDDPPTIEGPRIISKPRTVLLKGVEDIMTTISAPTTVIVNSINPIQIQFGALCFGVKIEDDENNMVPIAPCQIKIEGRHFVKGEDGHIMTKLRMALLQEGEDDELMAHQNISANNQMQRTGKYYEEFHKLVYDLLDMWRRPASTGRRLQTCPNCQIYMGDSTHKSNSEFNSSPDWNPGEFNLKTDAQVAYDIQPGHSWTRWKDKEIIFPMGEVSYTTKI
jgi:hypothetical protein